MDRTAWIAVILCVVGLVVWEVYSLKQIQPKPAGTAQFSPSPTPNPFGASFSPTPSPTAAPVPAPAAETAPSFAEKIETLRNADAELRLTNRGGAIKEVVLLSHVDEKDARVILNSEGSTPIGAIVDAPNAPALPEFTASRNADGSVQYERVTPENVTIRKKFFFQPTTEKKDNYAIEMDVDLQNGGAQPYISQEYSVALGSASQIHPKDYPAFTRLVWCIAGSAKGVDVGWFAGGGGFLGIGAHDPRPHYQEKMAGAEWTAVSDQFFTTLIAPLTAKATGVWGRRFETKRWREQGVFGIEGGMNMPGFRLEPGQSYQARFEIYAGPKLYHRLAQLPHNEAEIMDFGIFKIVCQFLLNFMNLLHSWLGNYAAAILALTTIIKIVLWPIQNRATRTARQMALLGPKMQELREKHKDDPTRMNQETMKLYKQYGINPVGGCLPMLIQIPIFFGLFTMLRQTVELRNARFWWIHDLSQPDTIGYLPVLEFPINILPLIMAATSVWLMWITPKSGDPTQQRMMMFMPLIFVIFCYNFAAALALYYTAQNLLSILQLYYTQRQPLPTLEKVAPAGKQKR